MPKPANPAPFTLREFGTRDRRSARRNSRGGVEAIEAGTPLWAIYMPGGGYFTFSYTSREAAQLIADKLREDEKIGRLYADFNRVATVEDTMHSTVTVEQIKRPK